MAIDIDTALRSPAIQWDRERLRLLDQRLLPAQMRYVECVTANEVADAIRSMVVRGAPAIGIAAAYGVALAVRMQGRQSDALKIDLETLANARPTAVNLVWALNRLRPLVEEGADFVTVAEAAEAIHAEDVETNRRLAQLGSERLEAGARVLTHCNTGPLATGGVGTALGVIVAAWRRDRITSVHFSETRPWMQGARLTAWELSQAGVPATLVTESAAGGLALAGAVDWLIVGADRVAANGDVVNKVGTAPLAALTREGGGRVMVVAPFSTVDAELASGSEVPIERRSGDEVWRAANAGEIPEGIAIDNPAFDVTPAAQVDFLVAEQGVISPAKGERPGASKSGGMVK